MRSRILSILALMAATPAVAFVPATTQPRVELDAATVAPPPLALQVEFERAVPGAWTLEWDLERRTLASGRRGRTPASSAKPAIASQAAAIRVATDFRTAAAAFLGVDAGAALAPVRCERMGRAWHVTWQQQAAGGVPILDAVLDITLHAESGVAVAFRAGLVPYVQVAPPVLNAEDAAASASRHVGEPVERLAAAAVAVAGATGLRPAWRLDLRGAAATARWDVVVAADDGAILRLDRTARPFTGTCSADIVAAYADDVPSSVPLPWLDVDYTDFRGARATNADALGHFQFEVDPTPDARLAAGLQGLYAFVTNAVGAPGARVARTVASGTALHFDAASGRLDERTIYAHTNIIHDYVRSTFDFRLMDFPLPAVAGEQAYANAYWNGDGMHFGDGGMIFHNLGLFADVIYHEYTHGITDYMYRPLGGLTGAQGAALHEGLSDYFACTLTGESRVGEGLYRNAPDQALRELENTLRWPDDRRGEEHADGEIFAGALWDLRQAAGAEVADRVVHFARALGPRTFEAYANAVLLQDDLQYGDGQAANGSPHRSAILAAFAAHGIGPAAGPGRVLVHTPAGDTEAVGEARTLRAGFEGHASSPIDSLVFEFSTGGAFSAWGMQRLPDGDFAVTLPGEMLAEGVTVRYWIRTVARRGLAVQVLPPGAPATTYAFRVGADVEPPRIDHVALGRAAAIAWPAQLTARIEDNVGIAAAWVETWSDGVASARLGLVRTPADRDVWTTQFVNVGGAGTVIEYRIVAVDASRAGLMTCIPSCDATLRCDVVADLDDDFEAGSGGFGHGSIRAGRGDAWRLGAPQDGGPGRAWVCGGVDGGEYEPGLAAALTSPTLQIGSGARATIRSWIDAEPNAAIEAFDCGVVEIEIDGDGRWEPLTPVTGYTHAVAATDGANILPAGTPCLSGRDATWRTLEFDLGAWPGRRVRLRFVFAADTTPSSFGYRGWALDDFRVQPGAVRPTDVEPVAAARVLAASADANPGRGGVGIRLAVPPGAGRVDVRLYDVRGGWVRDLWSAEPGPGVHRLHWDGTDAGGLARPAGVYYYRVDSRRGGASGKLVLLR